MTLLGFAIVIAALAQIPPPRVPKPPHIEPILYYDSGALRYRPQNQPNLDATLNYIRTGVPTRVLITSRTDTVGSAAANLALSRRRAQIIADILVREGVDPAIIQINAVGESALARPTDDGVDEPLNRLIWIAVNF